MAVFIVSKKQTRKRTINIQLQRKSGLPMSFSQNNLFEPLCLGCDSFFSQTVPNLSSQDDLQDSL
jgi:hypothetical protein